MSRRRAAAACCRRGENAFVHPIIIQRGLRATFTGGSMPTSYYCEVISSDSYIEGEQKTLLLIKNPQF